MDFIMEYGKTVFDVALVLFFLFIIFINLPLGRLVTAIKGLMVAVVIWFIARILNLPMAEASLSYVIQFGFLGLMIMFPREFRMLLENMGRRKIFSWNMNRLIEKESRYEVAKAVSDMARTRTGGIIVIAREDSLEDEAYSGDYIGEMAIKEGFITSLMAKDSDTSKGALIIQDDRIISTNVKLPMLRNRALEDNGAGKRHFAGLGIVNEKDCMAIVVSGETGAISFFGKKDGKVVVEFALFLKDVDMVEGIDEDDIAYKIYELLKGKTAQEVKKEKAQKKSARQEKGTAKQKAKKKPDKKVRKSAKRGDVDE